MGQDETRIGKFNGVITCEPPNNNLNKFNGRLTWNGKQYSLDNEKILLRGCVLRNTQWCYGVVVFAGRDTKLEFRMSNASMLPHTGAETVDFPRKLVFFPSNNRLCVAWIERLYQGMIDAQISINNWRMSGTSDDNVYNNLNRKRHWKSNPWISIELVDELNERRHTTLSTFSPKMTGL